MPPKPKSAPEIRLARHRPSQSRVFQNDPDGALIQALTRIWPARTKTPNPRARALGPESGAGRNLRFGGRRLWTQMQDWTGLGFSSALSEFQEKMRLGGICRLGFALLSCSWFRVRCGHSTEGLRFSVMGMPARKALKPARGAVPTLIPEPQSVGLP